MSWIRIYLDPGVKDIALFGPVIVGHVILELMYNILGYFGKVYSSTPTPSVCSGVLDTHWRLSKKRY